MKEHLFIQAKAEKIDKQIEESIQRAGIQYPHHSLRFFKARYALADGESPNGNNVLLEKSVQEDVPYLIGTQVNRDHDGTQRIGYVLNSFVINDEIQIIICFDTTYLESEYEEANKLLEEGKLHVSFELMVEKKNIKIEGRIKRLSHVEFVGVGLLFDVEPAYKDGHVIAKAMKIIEDALKEENKQLLFANVEDISKKWMSLGEKIEKIIKDIKLNNDAIGGDNQMDEKAKKALLDKFKAEVIAKRGKEVKDWTDEQFEAELIKQAEDEAKLEAQKKTAELKTKEEAEKKVKEQAEIQNRQSTEVRTYNVTEDTEAGTMEVVETIKTSNVVDGKEVCNEEVKRHALYTYAKMESEINKAKEEVKNEYESKLKEKDDILAKTNINELNQQLIAKDEEIKKLQAKITDYQTQERTKYITEIRAELGDFAKDLTDDQLFNEDKVTIARLTKQNSELKSRGLSLEVASQPMKVKLHAKVDEGNSTDAKSDDAYMKAAAKQAVQSK